MIVFLKKKKHNKIRLTFHDSLFQHVLYQCVMYKANIRIAAGLQPRSLEAESTLGKPCYRGMGCRASFKEMVVYRFHVQEKEKLRRRANDRTKVGNFK